MRTFGASCGISATQGCSSDGTDGTDTADTGATYEGDVVFDSSEGTPGASANNGAPLKVEHDTEAGTLELTPDWTTNSLQVYVVSDEAEVQPTEGATINWYVDAGLSLPGVVQQTTCRSNHY